ncbi:hypothetical protein [Streptomyces flavofungini]|uniref:Uncharacterized protein n=1 Tax=Streptomyces flavofungini TaxID=68200 RepID=A0ABS0XDA1_9ACTN|nr:hypothetical protein [Streptomyces flavofungini]MBJ3811193.1 hypothetical protein [Streptomyces flavofungini]GHC67467.1 hypothetical protein GCM10010349_40430 [Streptomyces flavofungini]
MSSSEQPRSAAAERRPEVPFVVIPDTPSVLVSVTDEAMKEVAHGMGTIETTVTPGIYRIEQRFAGAVASQLVEVGTAAFTARLPLPRIPAPAPVERTATTQAAHREATLRWSRESTHRRGRPSLMVLLRNLRRGWRFDPYALQITAGGGAAVDGGEPGWRADPQQGWAAWSGRLAPGGYRLRLREPTGEGLPLAQALWVSEGWTTLVFVGNGPYGPQPQDATVEMAPLGTGWRPADEALNLAREAALSGLRQGIDLTSDRQLFPMLDSGRPDSGRLDSGRLDPFLGIVGAHAMLLDRAPDLRRLDEVVQSLAPHIPGHPDLAALRTLLDGTPPQVTSPPMLAASCQLLIRADGADPGVIKDGSMAESVAEHLVGRGVWTTWLEEERRPASGSRSVLAGGPTGPRPSVADPVGRVQAYVREIAHLADKPVEEVLRDVPREELCRRTGLPHRPVDRAIEGLRGVEEG